MCVYNIIRWPHRFITLDMCPATALAGPDRPQPCFGSHCRDRKLPRIGSGAVATPRLVYPFPGQREMPAASWPQGCVVMKRELTPADWHLQRARGGCGGGAGVLSLRPKAAALIYSASTHLCLSSGLVPAAPLGGLEGGPLSCRKHGVSVSTELVAVKAGLSPPIFRSVCHTSPLCGVW